MTKLNQPNFNFLQQNSIQPIIKEQTYRHISIPLDGDIEDDLSLYRDCIETIKDAGQGDVVSLIINTRGGSLKTALAIISALEYTDAETVAIIEGEAASAGSLIAMHCQNVELNPYSTLFIHSESFGSIGKRSEVKAQVEFNLDWVENIFRNSYFGFLTDEEMDRVLAGADLYFDAEQILERLTIRQQKYQELAEQEESEDEIADDCMNCIGPDCKAYDNCEQEEVFVNEDNPPPEYNSDDVSFKIPVGDRVGILYKQ